MLVERIDVTGLAPFRFQGWTGKRLTTSFGWSYDFEEHLRPMLDAAVDQIGKYIRFIDEQTKG